MEKRRTHHLIRLFMPLMALLSCTQNIDGPHVWVNIGSGNEIVVFEEDPGRAARSAGDWTMVFVGESEMELTETLPLGQNGANGTFEVALRWEIEEPASFASRTDFTASEFSHDRLEGFVLRALLSAIESHGNGLARAQSEDSESLSTAKREFIEAVLRNLETQGSGSVSHTQFYGYRINSLAIEIELDSSRSSPRSRIEEPSSPAHDPLDDQDWRTFSLQVEVDPVISNDLRSFAVAVLFEVESISDATREEGVSGAAVSSAVRSIIVELPYSKVVENSGETNTCGEVSPRIVSAIQDAVNDIYMNLPAVDADAVRTPTIRHIAIIDCRSPQEH